MKAIAWAVALTMYGAAIGTSGSYWLSTAVAGAGLILVTARATRLQEVARR